jgi:hypothetical protein
LVLLTACRSDSKPLLPVLAERCVPVDGHHDSVTTVTSPEDGVLRLRIDERGVSLIATLDGDPKSAAESPVERLGAIELVFDTRSGQQHTVTVRAEDSPDIHGEYCVRADLIAADDSARQTAERGFAAAGRATHSHDWTAAFDEYLGAARKFDHLRDRRSSGGTRSAMAEIAYLRLDRKRDSYALAAEALANYDGAAEPYVLGGLAAPS